MELITVGEMDDLPDDPATAFVQLERICRTRLNAMTGEMERYEHGDDLRLEYITVVAAAAAAYGIADFGEASELRHDDFRTVYQRAIAVATRLAIEGKRARELTSVALPIAAKERLKKHLLELRAAVQQSGLDDRKKAILNKRLDSFDSELGKEKSSVTIILVGVALVTAALSQGTGAITGAEDAIIKLPETVNAINILLGREKLREIEAAPDPLPLPSPVLPKALPNPAKPEVASRTRADFADDLDDVPF
ncbi:hypothetical protein U1769_14635 [Sphingomonas sp. ZT3P38]|uniref:hypothetical protein n=1 Tax=Parasphingomonas zepuensis TaxID=3096161 RepID=UPI002FCB75C4